MPNVKTNEFDVDNLVFGEVESNKFGRTIPIKYGENGAGSRLYLHFERAPSYGVKKSTYGKFQAVVEIRDDDLQNLTDIKGVVTNYMKVTNIPKFEFSGQIEGNLVYGSRDYFAVDLEQSSKKVFTNFLDVEKKEYLDLSEVMEQKMDMELVVQVKGIFIKANNATLTLRLRKAYVHWDEEDPEDSDYKKKRRT